MYARSTTIAGEPGSLDAGITHVRDTVMPLVQGLEGWVGLSMLCDRESGRCIITTSWETEEALRTSGPKVRASRGRAGDIFRAATDPEVQEWEVAVMHRVRETGEGACARVIWCRAQTGQVDRIMEAWRTEIPPQLEQMPGFCGVSVLVDRASAHAVAAVSYESREAMDRSAEQGLILRSRFADRMGFDITDVAEFDIVLAHLRVPELA
jgi:heme-degrading monooxygenase HmoA